MANITITNNDLSSVEHRDCRYQDETLNLSGAQTVAAGRILARDSVSLKLVNYVPGGAALKSTGDGTFNLDPGDAFVLDVDDVGNATVTFDANPSTVADTTVYTGGTSAVITDTTTYPVADQDGLTSIITVDGGAPQTVTFSGAHTTALQIAASMNDQLSGCSVVVAGGQVQITADSVGIDSTLAAAAGTGGLTWGAPVNGTGGLANQNGLTEIVTLTGGPFDGVAQTVTFSGVTTEVAQVAAQMAAQLDGCSVEVSGGQLLITHDGKGTGMDITIGTGTCALAWAASTAGTGDVVDIDAVTATEVKTRIEADTNATCTVSGDACVIKGTTELDFISGTALTKLGLSVETITANDNGTPKYVMGYQLAGSNGDNYIRAIASGEVRLDKLSIADGTTVTAAHTDQLKNYGIVAVDVSELQIQDNQ
jgi:hypothetical protein